MAEYKRTRDQSHGDVIEIVPAEEYDWHKAKLKASLSWLMSKVYSSDVPKELQDPFYETAEGQLVPRPVLVNLLSSSELYCQACSNMFPETHTQWQGHWSIIQVLSRKGIYISDVQDSAVTETVLVQTAPFRLKAHLALIDALMKAYVCEVASVEKVVQAVRRFTTFPASSELPAAPEEALIFWVNKVCTVLRTEGLSWATPEEVIEGEAGQKVRVFKKSVCSHEPVQVPLLKDLMRDIGDGCSVAAVIAYYRPHLLNIKDLCLKEGIGLADSLHNLRQISQFCQDHLPWKCCHLSYEDLLYTHEVMKANVNAFLADLFCCFEGPGSCRAEGSELTAAKPSREKTDVPPAAVASRKSSQTATPAVPISQVTKRSFQRQSFEDTASNLGMGRSTLSTSPNLHQPLLPRRGRRSIPQDEGVFSGSPPTVRRVGRCSIPQDEGVFSGSPPTVRRVGRRTLSLCSPQDREMVHKSVLAWNDDQTLSQRSGGLLANVSIDSELNQSFSNNESLSLDLSELDTPRATSDPKHADYMELESITSADSNTTCYPHRFADSMSSRTLAARNVDHRLEPLMPAMLRHTKERETGLSKAEERGDRMFRRKKSSPLQQTEAPLQQMSETGDLDVSLSVSSDETSVSSLAPGEGQSPLYMQQSRGSHGRSYDALMAGTDSLEATSYQGDFMMPDTDIVGSYAPEDHVSNPQTARTAGIPLVIDSGYTACVAPPSWARSREGSVASSGEYSDHESKKIHQEYKVRESGLTPPIVPTDTTISDTMNILASDHQENTSTTNGYTEGSEVLSKSPSSTTSFAELKRLKDKLGYNLDQTGSHGVTLGVDLKSAFVIRQGQGQEQGQDTSQAPGPDGPVVESNGIDLDLSELQHLRLKLEQKRKEIEKKKHRQELQQNKMRQRLGKAAFMRVVSKHLDGRDEDDLCELPDYSSNSTQAQLQARLGHQPQKLPLGSHYRVQPQTQPYPLQVAIGPGGQGSVTDWRALSHLSKLEGSNLSDFASTAQRPGSFNHMQHQRLLSEADSADGCSPGLDSSIASSQVSGSKPFSRAGIQQKIDNVRNKWFKSDILPDKDKVKEEVGDGRDTFRLHGHDNIPGTSFMCAQKAPASRSHVQSPVPSTSQTVLTHRSTPISIPTHSATPHVPVPTRDVTSSPVPGYDSDHDPSIEKLTSSLSELQGEIMRLSLQQEQFKATQSPATGQPGGFVPGTDDALSDSTHGFSQHIQEAVARQREPHTSSHPQHFPPSTISVPYQITTDVLVNADMDTSLEISQPSSSISSQHTSYYENGPTSHHPRQHTVVPDDLTSDGFFVLFGEKTTPKRTRPKLSSGSEVANVSGASYITDDVAATLAGQTVLATVTSQERDLSVDDSTPKVGFIIKDESAVITEQVHEDEMHKKRIKLIEMQRKRKEEQEKKRTEKEAEMARKLEEKQLKEEEQERKKAEEKARREVIFQQYLQKKQEDEEAPAKPRSKKRDGSAGKQRPKSMFVKSKGPSTETGALDSGSSSQEDLTSRTHTAGRSTPHVMSTMQSSLHSRLPKPSQIRKAVSCNTLQGPSNGTHVPSTNRRPPSPDLYRLKQRHRGSSQDSGSETGSGSNPGSDYAGPKLFVKPSSRSNRHIIVNAVSHCCLAGSVNTDLKNKVLEEMSRCDANHFLILFRDGGCQYRGLFVFYPEAEEAVKVHGVGPKHIVNDMCEKFYKYNSGGKSFSEITSTKHLSVSVDAVVLHGSVWKSGKAAVKR